jgi:hypothetical protein
MKIQFSADDVRLDVAKDPGGKFVPSVASSNNGSLLVEFGKTELESMLLAFAKAAAAEQGVKIESAELSLAQAGERAVEGTVRVKARQMMSVTVIITGRADVDEKLNVTLSNLSAKGEGFAGTVAAGFLGSKLKPYEGRRLPLAGEYLKNVRLTSLKLDAGDPLRVTAQFT